MTGKEKRFGTCIHRNGIVCMKKHHTIENGYVEKCHCWECKYWEGG